MTESEHNQPVRDTRALVNKLEAVGWGVFFIWVGLAFLADVGWEIGFLGAGVIALGTQTARKYFGLPVEWFWVAIGIVFVLWSVWELLKIQLGGALIPGGLMPILFIVIGIVLVVSALRHKPQH